LVPFPDMNFLTPSMSRIKSQDEHKILQKKIGKNSLTKIPTSIVDSLFNDIGNYNYSLLTPRNASSTANTTVAGATSLSSTSTLYLPPVPPISLSCCVLSRGPLTLTDVHRGISSLKNTLKFPSWNPDGFKIGMCGEGARDSIATVISLNNSTSVHWILDEIRSKFNILFKRRAHLHHYTDEGMDMEEITLAHDTVRNTSELYNDLEERKGQNTNTQIPNNKTPRFQPAI